MLDLFSRSWRESNVMRFLLQRSIIALYPLFRQATFICGKWRQLDIGEVTLVSCVVAILSSIAARFSFCLAFAWRQVFFTSSIGSNPSECGPLIFKQRISRKTLLISLVLLPSLVF